ncbi:MAG: hypothetical protein EOM67_10285 [Spirochaetia bacterium]|nr:hypothetical protein [Spirochaetia bacterium]
MITIPLVATDIFDTGWEFHLVDSNFFYPNYIADPFSPRFSADARTLSINEIALDSDERLDITAGTRFSLFSFRKSDNPDIGVQLDLWLTIPMFMEGGSNDFLGMDGIYSLGLVISPTDWITARLSRHHICTHAGDEIDTTADGDVSIDYDPTPNFNSSIYVRDDFGVSLAIKPLNILNIPWMDDMLLLYGDYYFFWPGEDPLGSRQIKPARDAYSWYTVGAEIKTPELYGARLFSAAHISYWEELNWMPSYAFDFGLEIKGAVKGLTLRVAYNLYDGRSIINNFYNRRERFSGISISIDR